MIFEVTNRIHHRGTFHILQGEKCVFINLCFSSCQHLEEGNLQVDVGGWPCKRIRRQLQGALFFWQIASVYTHP